MNEFTLSRRVFVTTLSLVAGGVALRTRADDTPILNPKDPAAAALGYVEDASKVDIHKYPAFVQGSNCENCLKLEGTAGNQFRPCSLFPGKRVSVSGWCSGWTAEM